MRRRWGGRRKIIAPRTDAHQYVFNVQDSVSALLSGCIMKEEMRTDLIVLTANLYMSELLKILESGFLGLGLRRRLRKMTSSVFFKY